MITHLMPHRDFEYVIKVLGKRRDKVLLLLVYNVGKYFYVLLHVNLVIFLEWFPKSNGNDANECV